QLLLDPENITVVADENTPNQLAANDAFNDPGGDNTINNGTINAAMANVILQATNNITFDAPINISASGVGITAQTNNEIVVNQNIRTNGGNVTLNADFDNINGGILDITNATIDTGGGNFIGTGKGNAASTTGVTINNSTINTGDGSIDITGTGGDGGDNNFGIVVNDGSVIETTGIGAITLNGTGGNGIDNNDGISISNLNSRISSVNGTISLTGNGGAGTGEFNDGISIVEGSTVTSSETGNITLTGTGGIGTNGNDGIKMQDADSTVSSVNGNISLTGNGGEGTGEFNDGISIVEGSAVTSSENGNITLTGTGGNSTGDNNHGVSIQEGALVQSTGTGAIEITGTTDATSNGEFGNDGISIVAGGGVESTGSGNITLVGTGGQGTISNQGIVILEENSRVTSVNGAIFLQGTSQGTGTDHYGIWVGGFTGLGFGGGVVQTTGTGNISLEGIINGSDNTSEGILVGDDGGIAAIGLGNISLTANEIRLGTIQGNTLLQVQPLDANLGITIGNTINDTRLNLNTNELNRLQNGFTQLIIGRDNNTGTITLAGDATFNDPVTLQANSINYTSGTLFGDDNATLTLLANQDITTGDILNPSRDITLTSDNGIVTTENLNSSGNSGGNIVIQAEQAITTGEINTSGSVGDGGNVILDPSGDIQVSVINAQGGSNGNGGNVDITTERFFRATNDFTDQNGTLTSISTAGGIEGGDITIRHWGGLRGTSFDVGDGITNGTSAGISSGEFTISPFESFPGSFTLGNIQIITPTITGTCPPYCSQTDDTDDITKESAIVASSPVFNPVAEAEAAFTSQYEEYLGLGDTPIITLAQAQATLQRIERVAGVKPALVYVMFVPTNASVKHLGKRRGSQRVAQRFAEGDGGLVAMSEEDLLSSSGEQLELILVTAEGEPIRFPVPGATREKVLNRSQQLRRAVTDVRIPRPYLPVSQQLYQWLIA
ncbi:MAG: hypothetical protein RLP02_26280, partial [Coleofasciculus sp. C2-GNP5-27]